MLEVLNFFSRNISHILKEELKDKPIQYLEEIRLRSNGTIALKFSQNSIVLYNKVTYQDILETLQIMCNNSIYSYQNEIKQGFITVKGGHRVGITGNCAIENGKVININYISSINFRIAKQIIGAGNKVLQYILRLRENTIYNTLIISPPGVRKNHSFKRPNKEHKHRNRRNTVWRFKCRFSRWTSVKLRLYIREFLKMI